MRACIKPEIRCKGISADFNSVEVRVGAGLSGDEQMQYLIAQGDLYPDRKKEFDFHWRTAITCYGESATKENRYNSKRINFAKMFGSGKQSCANLVGVPVHEVSMAFDAFSAIAPQYEAWDTKMREYVKNGGRSFEAYSGRPLWMDPDAEWGAGNTAIQGTARELAVDATLKWQAGPWGHLTLLIVHDELCVWNVPEDEAEAATAELVRCMETSIFGVQIRAEANEPWDAWPDAS
jgi:DNA polymerase I-like protein with 3'-5' exonuclease and polymerase domains